MIEYTLEDSLGLCGSPLSVSPNAITLNGNTLDHRGLSRDIGNDMTDTDRRVEILQNFAKNTIVNKGKGQIVADNELN
jgi:hypothetical protein